MSSQGFRAHPAPELRLDHGESGLDIGSLVVLLQEFVAVLIEELKMAIPYWVTLAFRRGCHRVDLEGNPDLGPDAFSY